MEDDQPIFAILSSLHDNPGHCPPTQSEINVTLSYALTKTAENYCGNKKCTNINMQYSQCSSLQLRIFSDTHNRQEAVYTRTSSLQGGISACQAFSTVTYNLQTTSACTPHLPPQQRGGSPCTSIQHPTAYTLLGPLTYH